MITKDSRNITFAKSAPERRRNLLLLSIARNRQSALRITVKPTGKTHFTA
jgi:hypothetical protein